MKDRLPSWPCCFLSTVSLYSSSSFSVSSLKGLGGRERVCSSSSMMKAWLKGESKMTIQSLDVMHFAVNRSSYSCEIMTTGYTFVFKSFSKLLIHSSFSHKNICIQFSYRNVKVQISSFDPVMDCVDCLLIKIN